ncbi:MAG: hypothetical protein H3C36_02990 [Chitinophagaceae bacterium]|nr:hypothetical protein [Chitinophagaceae bacterium]
MKFSNDKLQLTLNYDTYADNYLEFDERMEIHHAISYKMNYGVEFNLPPKLSLKLFNALETIKNTSYQPKTAMWYEEKNAVGVRRIKFI